MLHWCVLYVHEAKNYNFHKNKIRTNEPKIWQNNKNTGPEPKFWFLQQQQKECISSISIVVFIISVRMQSYVGVLCTQLLWHMLARVTTKLYASFFMLL